MTTQQSTSFNLGDLLWRQGEARELLAKIDNAQTIEDAIAAYGELNARGLGEVANFIITQIEVSDAMRAALNPTVEERARRERIGATDAEIIAAQLAVDLTPNTGGARLRAILNHPVLFDDTGILGEQDDYLRGEAAKQAAPVDPAPTAEPSASDYTVTVDCRVALENATLDQVIAFLDSYRAAGWDCTKHVSAPANWQVRHFKSGRTVDVISYGRESDRAAYLNGRHAAPYQFTLDQLEQEQEAARALPPAAVDTGAMHGPAIIELGRAATLYRRYRIAYTLHHVNRRAYRCPDIDQREDDANAAAQAAINAGVPGAVVRHLCVGIQAEASRAALDLQNSPAAARRLLDSL